jgi:IclR family pca regulon transcriptional regulator
MIPSEILLDKDRTKKYIWANSACRNNLPHCGILTMPRSERKRNFINSLEKGLSILTILSQAGPQLTLTELSRAARMGLGSVSRYLQTLMELGYLTRDPVAKTYRLAPKILSLGSGLIKNMDLRARVTPYLAEVNREFGVGTQCAILDDTEIVYVERFRARSLVALDLTIGSRIPAYCTALGRAILAFLDEESKRRIVSRMDIVPLTRFTVSDKGGLLRELEITRRRGYAVNVQELVLGQAGIAAPIFHRKAVEGSFGFSFPHEAMKDEKWKSTLIKRLEEIVEKVSIREHGVRQ